MASRQSSSSEPGQVGHSTAQKSEPGAVPSGPQYSAAGTLAATLGGGLLRSHRADVGQSRERARLRRLNLLALGLSGPLLFLWWRIIDGRGLNFFQVPMLTEDALIWVLPIVIILAILVMVAMPLMSGRSPHSRIAPDQIETGFADVVGLDNIVDEVTRTLNTFMAHKLYRDRLGGTPRRGVMFEGPPGTGKTYLAKAMAHEAGVPFLFVSATSFQSMWYGATARKVRSYFAALRKAARQDGGAIGFIEEIDAIAQARGGMRSDSQPLATNGMSGACLHSSVDAFGPDLGGFQASPRPGGLTTNAFGSSEGASGVVNELLVQLQSFDTPPTGVRVRNWFTDKLNGFLPHDRQIAAKPSPYHNILVIAATNRAGDLDAALMRPGRFDKQLSFEPPAKPQRRDLLDYYLARKAHSDDLDTEDAREMIAGQTLGYTPVMIENLLDEALVVSLKNGHDGMTFADLQQARPGHRGGPGNTRPLHQPRTPASCDTRSRPRSHGPPVGPSPAGDPVDHQAEVGPGPAGARRRRGDLHPDPQGDVRHGRHRHGREGSGGDLVRRKLHRSGQ